jgi:UDP-2,4-diacetamido-2,4,6-trideoxy-beta-L-altropyranose hydrolase
MGDAKMRGLPHVALRVDASAAMGTGHLRRCLSLAKMLIELGVKVNLLTRRLDGVAIQLLAGSAAPDGLCVHWLPTPVETLTTDGSGPPHQDWAGVRWIQDVNDVMATLCDDAPNWMVVDHYAFDERWHAAVRHGLGCRILVIDDTADRILDADALLDQNWDSNHNAKYASKLRREPMWLTGPPFALLDKAFRTTPRYRFHREVRSLGVFMGGIDHGRVAAKILHLCRESGFSGLIEVVSTSANPHLAALRTTCATLPDTQVTLDEPNLAHFFSRHDLQIGAGGSATWERCCMAVPSIAMVVANNQRHVLEPLRNMGVLQIAEEQAGDLATQIHALIVNPEVRRSMSERSSLLVDGNGIVRVANFLIDAC